MARKTVMLLLQQLEFVLNLKKYVLTLTKRTELLRVTLDSLFMTLSLPISTYLYQVSKVRKQCLELLQVSTLELAKLIGLLPSTIQAVLPAQINFKYLQQQQIQALKSHGHIAKTQF